MVDPAQMETPEQQSDESRNQKAFRSNYLQNENTAGNETGTVNGVQETVAVAAEPT